MVAVGAVIGRPLSWGALFLLGAEDAVQHQRLGLEEVEGGMGLEQPDYPGQERSREDSQTARPANDEPSRPLHPRKKNDII